MHRDGFLFFGVRYPSAYHQRLIAWMHGDRDVTQRVFTAARLEAEKLVLADAANAAELGLLTMIEAQQGHGEVALREAKHACEMSPPNSSPAAAAVVASDLVFVYAWTDRGDLALDELERWLARPTDDGIPFRLSYGDLRLDPLTILSGATPASQTWPHAARRGRPAQSRGQANCSDSSSIRRTI